MEDPEGVLSFDFEGGLETAAPANPPYTSATSIPPNPDASNPMSVAGPNAPGSVAVDLASGGGGNLPGRRSFRQTVCRHWLRGLCMKGDACGFLHQYDKSRMPVCRFFRLYGECREQDCVYKHTNEDIKECNMYKLGFCPNGPDCRYRHAKLPGPPPSVEEVFQKIQHLSSFSHGSSNRFFQHRNTGFTQQKDKPQIPQGTGAVNQDAAVKASTTMDLRPIQQPQQQIQHPQQQQLSQNQSPNPSQNQTQNLPNGFPNQGIRTALPLPQGQSRYFVVKSCNRENLETSVQQGVWATQRSNEAKLNEAFESSENVILIFSVNRTRHFQGCAKMTSKIGGFVGGGNWKHANGTAHYGRNFSVKWLKLSELSFHKTRHLRNPYNENLPVKISRDCQELEPFIGEQLASLHYLEPDSELMAMLVAAESKREEEKAKGVSADDTAENPDIVPFEDNEEDEDEESEEEEESFAQTAQGRGRGRGMMWPAHMPLIHGGRPMLGVRNFPPVMMGADRFGYGAVVPDGFAPRMFTPYGAPGFPGDFSGLGQNAALGFSPMDGSGMFFPGRPSQHGPAFPAGGFGMMGGPGRPPFMGGGMAMVGAGAGRANRPLGMMPPFRPPPPPFSNSRAVVKRDERRSGSEHGDRNDAGLDPGNKGQDIAGQEDGNRNQQGSRSQHDDSSGLGNKYRNDGSESEDEAPRRSRRGSGGGEK